MLLVFSSRTVHYFIYIYCEKGGSMARHHSWVVKNTLLFLGENIWAGSLFQ